MGFWDTNLTVTVLTTPQTCWPYCTQCSLCQRDPVYIQTLHSTLPINNHFCASHTQHLLEFMVIFVVLT